MSTHFHTCSETTTTTTHWDTYHYATPYVYPAYTPPTSYPVVPTPPPYPFPLTAPRPSHHFAVIPTTQLNHRVEEEVSPLSKEEKVEKLKRMLLCETAIAVTLFCVTALGIIGGVFLLAKVFTLPAFTLFVCLQPAAAATAAATVAAGVGLLCSIPGYYSFVFSVEASRTEESLERLVQSGRSKA